MADGELEKKLREHLGRTLRRVFRYSPLKAAVYQRDKLPSGDFRCYLCKGTSSDKTDFHIEHVSPVVPPERDYVSALEYFRNMFSMGEDGSIYLANLQLCCIACHAEKTDEERDLRVKYKTGPYSAAAVAKRGWNRARKAKKRR